MTWSALTMLMAAACIHATWNAAAKSARGNNLVFVWAYAGVSTVIYLPVAIWQLLRHDTAFSWVLIAAPAVSGVLHIAYSMFLQTGYSKADLGVVYPTARGVGPLLTMTVALVLLGEDPGAWAVIGGLVVLLGILVVATGHGLPGSASGHGSHHRRLRSGIIFGVATGVAIASYTLWDNHAVVTWHLDPIVLFTFTHAVQGVLMTPSAVARRSEWRESLRPNATPIVAVAVLAPISYILVLYAMKTTPVSLVAPVRETSIVIGAVMAWLIFGEGNPGRRVAGAAVVVAGISLIASQ